MKIIKKLLTGIGFAVTAASIYFLLTYAVTLRVSLTAIRIGWKTGGFLALFAVIYCASLFMLAYAWKLIIEFVGNGKMPMLLAFSLYMRSNLAKYVPGNVWHLAARNYLGSRLGWRHSDIALGSFLEVAGLGGVTMFLGGMLVLAGFRIPEPVSFRINAEYIVAAMGFVLGTFLLLSFRRARLLINPSRALSCHEFLSLLAKIFLMYLLFLTTSGAILSNIFPFILEVPVRISETTGIAGAYVVAWFVGFAMPGAPGGLGVREAVLVIFLSPIYGRESALLSSMIFRTITVLGEILAFLVVVLQHAVLRRGEDFGTS